MAWIATENFESYADNDDLNTKAGGTNWTGNWAVIAGAGTVQNTPTLEAGLCAEETGTNDVVRRTFTAVTDGIVSWIMRRDDLTTPGVGGVLLQNNTSGNGLLAVNFTGTNIDLVGTTTVSILASPSTNTNYTIHLHIDRANNRYRARVGSNEWSAYVTEQGNEDPDRFVMRFQDSPSGSMWIDDIKAGSDPASASAGTKRRMLIGVG